MCKSIVYIIGKLQVNNRLLIVKLWGSQKLYPDFRLRGLISLTPILFEGQLYS